MFVGVCWQTFLSCISVTQVVEGYSAPLFVGKCGSQLQCAFFCSVDRIPKKATKVVNLHQSKMERKKDIEKELERRRSLQETYMRLEEEERSRRLIERLTSDGPPNWREQRLKFYQDKRKEEAIQSSASLPPSLPAPRPSVSTPPPPPPRPRPSRPQRRPSTERAGRSSASPAKNRAVDTGTETGARSRTGGSRDFSR